MFKLSSYLKNKFPISDFSEYIQNELTFYHKYDKNKGIHGIIFKVLIEGKSNYDNITVNDNGEIKIGNSLRYIENNINTKENIKNYIHYITSITDNKNELFNNI